MTTARPSAAATSQQRRVFDDLRALLDGRTVSRVSGLYAVGRHGSIRATVSPEPDGRSTLHVLLSAFQPELVRWRDLQICVQGRADDDAVAFMPIPLYLDDAGRGSCRLPLHDVASRWEIRLPASAAVPRRGTDAAHAWLPLRAGWAADTSDGRQDGWEPVPFVPGAFVTESPDRRLRASVQFREDRVDIAFDAVGDCQGLGVRWTIGKGDRVERTGVLPLTPGDTTTERWRTEPIATELPFDRHLYFELVELQPGA